MESQRLFLLYALLSMTEGALEKIWEFGVDAPGSIIVDHRADGFSLFDKTKEIKLKTPQCYVMEYVRVQVKNSISKPAVSFNKTQNVVTIAYKPLQYSVSTFNITAKAARKPGCFNQTVEMQMRHTFSKCGLQFC